MIKYDENLLAKVQSQSPIEKSFWDTWRKLVYSEIRPEQVRDFELIPQHKAITEHKYRVDFAHPRTKIAIELDGFTAHHTTSQVAYDNRRQRKFIANGWTVIRFGGQEVH